MIKRIKDEVNNLHELVSMNDLHENNKLIYCNIYLFKLQFIFSK